MKENYTSAEARAALHVDAKTFLRWLAEGKITPEVSKADRRVKLFTHEQIAQLADEHGRLLSAKNGLAASSDEITAPTSTQARLATLEARIEALEIRLSTLAEKKHQGARRVRKLAPQGAAVAPSQETLRDGLVFLRAFARSHGFVTEQGKERGMSTIQDAVEAEELPTVKGKWKQGRGYVHHALDAAGQAQFHKVFHTHAYFTACPLCPHLVEET